MNEITKRTIESYKNYLVEEEKCSVTIKKYVRDITAFVNWTEGKEIIKTLVLEYKSMLTQQYAPASVNSVLSSLNGYFNYIERYDLKVKNLKVQRQIFCQNEKELTKAEYERLLKAAKSKKNERLYLIIQTICATEIRVSELKYVDVNSVMTGQAQVGLKGKIRMILLPKELCHEIVTDLKEKHPHIKRIYVRSAFQHIPDLYEDSLLNHYEGTYFPEHMENAGRASYVERNQEMINHSKFCVVYYDENYLPSRRKNSRRDLFDYQPKSGTKVAYDYAVKKKKHIINTLII